MTGSISAVRDVERSPLDGALPWLDKTGDVAEREAQERYWLAYETHLARADACDLAEILDPLLRDPSFMRAVKTRRILEVGSRVVDGLHALIARVAEGAV